MEVLVCTMLKNWCLSYVSFSMVRQRVSSIIWKFGKTRGIPLMLTSGFQRWEALRRIGWANWPSAPGRSAGVWLLSVICWILTKIG